MQGVIHLNYRAIKTDAIDVLKRQYEFMTKYPSVSPTNPTLSANGTTLYYDWVQGDLVTNLGDLVTAAQVVWGPPQPMDTKRVSSLYAYYGYVIQRYETVVHGDDYISLSDLILAFNTVDAYSLTWVNDVHGDLTAENALVEKATGRIVLIDAGSNRLKCAEIDFGKIAQSAFSPWEDRQLALDNNLLAMLCATAVNLMELTHWVRLLAHPEKWRNPERVKTVARKRVNELKGYLL